MSSVPVVPIALVSTLGALFYVDMQYKSERAERMELGADETTLAKPSGKKKLRLALMGVSVVLCLFMIYSMLSAKKATSSFENRVAHSANSLRSSMNFEGPGTSTEDFSKRVSNAAAELRKQIASSSADLSSNAPMGSSDLAAKASAEISQFIADNS